MGSFITRNGLAGLFFLGLMMFAISNLVGSEGEDGLLMKAARDFTGGAEEEAEVASQPAPKTVPAPAPSATTKPTSNAEFYDDAELIDTASGYDPTPDVDPDPKSQSESNEAMILPSPPPQTASQSGSNDSEPVAGMRVGNGDPIILDRDDDDS